MKTIEAIIKNPVFWYIVGAIIVVMFSKQILAGLGLYKTDEQKKQEAELEKLKTEQPDFTLLGKIDIPTGTKYVLKTDKSAGEISDEIWLSMNRSNVFNALTMGLASVGTDEVALFRALSKIQSQAQYQQVATKFYKKYGVDMTTKITGELDDIVGGKQDLTKFNVYLNKLPKFKPA